MMLEVEPAWTPPPGSPDPAPRVRGLGESTSWMKSRPHGHHHTSHVGLLPTLPHALPEVGITPEAVRGESTLKRSPNSTYHREMDSADHDQLPTAASTPRRPYGRSTNGRPRARGNLAHPPGGGTHLCRRGRGNTSSPMLASGPGDPHGGSGCTPSGWLHLKMSPQTQSQSPRLLAIILEMSNGMQEGQRPGEHTWRQKHFPLTFSIHVPGPGDGSHAPPRAGCFLRRILLSRQDWNHESQTERVLTDSSWGP